MRLHTHGLALELEAVSAVGAEDWCRVRVQATVPGFGADFEASLQGEDLVRFRESLDSMYASVGSAATARLCGAEPDIFLELEMQTLGEILGKYEFVNDTGGLSRATLGGSFVLDQSFLPTLSAAVTQLLRDLNVEGES